MKYVTSKSIHNAQLVSETAEILKEVFLKEDVIKDIIINTQDVMTR